MLQVDFSTQEAVKLGFRNVLDLEIRYIFILWSVSLINAIIGYEYIHSYEIKKNNKDI